MSCQANWTRAIVIREQHTAVIETDCGDLKGPRASGASPLLIVDGPSLLLGVSEAPEALGCRSGRATVETEGEEGRKNIVGSSPTLSILSGHPNSNSPLAWG